MYSSIKNILGLTLIGILFFTLIFNIHAGSSKKGPREVVELYVNALITGDLETIKACLAENLLKQRNNTFMDPSYSNFLVDRYYGSSFRINQQQERKNGNKIVDLEIILDSKDKLAIRLMLNKENKIIKEIIL